MTAVSADVTKLTKRENISAMASSMPTDDNFNIESFLPDELKALDFPMEDIEECVEDEDWYAQFQNLEPPSFEDLFCPRDLDGNDDMKPKNLSTSYGQTSQRNQLPRTAAKTTPGISSIRSEDLESIGSCAAQFELKFEKRTRSKLSRSKRSSPAIFNTQFFPSTSSNSSASENVYRWDASESDLEGSLTEEMSNAAKRKQKKKRNLSQLSSAEMRKLSPVEPGESRETKRCMHCAVTKTPQWREGPLGPKTLCNACGVRYRSGRLFPEYRPAASPTFVASVHSNSHKKVIELRNKGCQGATMGILSSAQ
ncbi:GATA transcription factor 11-like isoform X1 [Prunus yedoensis var. nudiflora]|uniref:GATA transcription factor 11-like isoform X1 n=1 Tax=Prunus yedoensis var. nudiflora TaxID=2094558 RepID=A0A314V0G2_PRUYE|nr:GATA transcription factor 11-like isoform X1 [Prunus yedoensis var. nudiflora]